MNEDNLIEPNENRKRLMYEFYLLTYQSDFDLTKKRHIMTSAFGYEKWCWRVIGITRQAIIRIADNSFKLPKGLQRDHFKQSRAETFNKIFRQHHDFEDWWNCVWENDETILMTKEEHNNHKQLDQNDVYPVDYRMGYLRNKAVVGIHFSKNTDGVFIKKMYEQYIQQIKNN